jgi:hypothetical protein
MAKKKADEVPANGDTRAASAVYQPEIETFTVIGTSPLLQNNPAAFIGKTEESTLGSKKVYVDEEEAKLRCYLDGEGHFCHPSQAYLKAMVKAVSGKKFGKVFATAALKGSVFVVEDLCVIEDESGKPLTKYEISRMPCVVGKSRVLRCRPMWPAWRMRLALEINLVLVSRAAVKESLVLAGLTVGIGDYRPEKSGRFGRFRVE